MSFVWPTSHVGMVHPLAPSARARTQGTWFLRMAEAAERGLSYDETKALFPDVDAATVETRKSLYEEFGLLYVALFICGNYARYYPDFWIRDVETHSPLALAIEQLISDAEKTMALLTLSELSRVYYVPEA